MVVVEETPESNNSTEDMIAPITILVDPFQPVTQDWNTLLRFARGDVQLVFLSSSNVPSTCEHNCSYCQKS